MRIVCGAIYLCAGVRPGGRGSHHGRGRGGGSIYREVCTDFPLIPENFFLIFENWDD